MSIENRAHEVLAQARQLAARAKSWADFSNGLYSPGGIVASNFPDESERQAFYDSEQCKEIDKILDALIKKFGIVRGASPTDGGGGFVVPVPPVEANTPQHG